MTYIKYEDWNPTDESLAVVHQADRIATQYAAQGYNLTLRQLFYRFVATDLLPNTQRSYKRLGDLVNKGRLAGLISWDHIEDRTRNLRALPTWATPAEIMEGARRQYREDVWTTQDLRIEVWVEKDALVDVIGRAANQWDVPFFSCRGYVSQSEMWAAGQRIIERFEADHFQSTLILHLGDHDPSGIDMTRDIEERIGMFTGWGDFEVRRIALNMDQIDAYQPPPNPAKLTDSRAGDYISRFGSSSWELDALEPSVLDDLIQTEIAEWVDMERLEVARAGQERRRGWIREAIAGMPAMDEEE